MREKESKRDEAFMRQTFALARRGVSWTNPNPMVGAILVKRGRVLGRGHHTRYGARHAEVEAMLSVGGNVVGSTLYVNLEPCSHHGKTPPCSDAIIRAGIRRVVCATLDPNKKVHGRGVRALRRHGIEVVSGVLERQARELNETFFAFHEKKRPFVTIKFASSLDGKIATRTGDSKWITNVEARNEARRLREQSQAILVGVNTVLRDNPDLGARRRGKKDPLRIIIDSALRTPLSARVFRDTNVLVATSTKAPKRKIAELAEKGIDVLEFTKRIDVKELLRRLYKRGIVSVLVEGGGDTIGSFVDARLVDKLHIFYAPMIIGGESAVHAVAGDGVATVASAFKLSRVTTKSIGDCLRVTAYALPVR